MIDNFRYKDLYFQGSVDKQLKIVVDNGTIIGNDNLFEDEFSLEESLCSQDSLVFGSCEANCVKFTIANNFEDLIDRYITVKQYIGGYTDDYMQLGVFKVVEDKPTADRMRREVVAYDRMYDIINTDCTGWYNGLTFPMTLRQFRNSFFTFLGIEQKSIDLINDNMSVEKTIEAQNITGKDVITAICEVNGCFGNINRFGQFRYVTLETISQGIYPSLTLYPKASIYPQVKNSNTVSIGVGKYISCEYENWRTETIDGIKIMTKENDVGIEVGDTDNQYCITSNFLLYGKSEDDLTQIATKILDKVDDSVYTPFSTDAVGNPCVQLGDSVRIITTKNEVIESYVLNRILKGIQGLYDTYSAKGSKKAENNLNTGENKFRQLLGKSNVLEREVEYTKSRIEDVNTGLSTEIEQTASAIRTELNNSVDELNTTIETTASGINAQITSIQTQLDGNIVTFSGNYIPTLANEPASAWTTDEIKDRHIGNVFYYSAIVEEEPVSNSYRFQKIDGVYSWEIITDSVATKAMEDATKALSEITGINNNLSANYWNKTETQTNIDASATSIRSDVSATYSTKAELEGLSTVYATQTQLSSAIEQTDREIDLSVSGSKWMSGGATYDYKGNGTPTDASAEKVGKNYLDVDSGKVYQCSESNNVYSWTLIGTLKSAEASINVALDPHEMISKINASADEIVLTGNRLIVDSNKFTLDGNGNAEFGGTINIANGSFKVDGQGNLFTARRIDFYGGAFLKCNYRYNELLISADIVSLGTQVNLGERAYSYDYYIYDGGGRFHGNLDGVADYASYSYYLQTRDINGNSHGTGFPLFCQFNGARFGLYVSGHTTEVGYAVRAGSGGSSRRFKHDITEEINEEIRPEILYDLPVIQFKYNEDYLENNNELPKGDIVGFIAEDVYKLYPNAAITHKDDKDNVVVDDWSPSSLVAPMLKLIQDQNKKIEELERRINDLEREVVANE